MPRRPFWLAQAAQRKRKSRALPAHQLEAPLQARCDLVFPIYGWRYYHRADQERDRYEERGFLDCLAVHPCGRIVFAENKSVTGVPTYEQLQWLAGVRANGHVEVYEWRPGDEDAITRVANCQCGLRFEPKGLLQLPGIDVRGGLVGR